MPTMPKNILSSKISSKNHVGFPLVEVASKNVRKKDTIEKIRYLR
jgi:hypothetical protein